MILSQPIALGGVARVGKDTLCALLVNRFNKKGFKAQRFALADVLKENLRQSLLNKYGIDVYNCTAEEKERIRPDLVEGGRVKRVATDGQYWTSILENRIDDANTVDVPIVTDIRYDFFPHDEVWWAQERMRGILIHVARYTIKDGKKVFVQPANKDEAENDPKLKSKADILLEWDTCIANGEKMSNEELLEKLDAKYGDFLDDVITTYQLHVRKNVR